MKLIDLTRGLFTKVDDQDYEFLSSFNWYADKGDGGYYATTNILIGNIKKKVKMHRVLLGANKGQIVDHKDRNTLNNQRSNLRLCNASQNNSNRSSAIGSTSKYLGVYFYKRDSNWRARIKKNGVIYNLGSFDSEIMAAQAYDKKAILLHGEFANLNFK